MSGFKFNFVNEDTTDESKLSSSLTKLDWLQSEEICLQPQLESADSQVQRAQMFVCGDLEIGHVIPGEIINKFSDTDNVSKADQQHSDLVTGKYEGGLKIWECTTDLVEFLLHNIETSEWKDTHVLDLGCGAGLLGIMTFIYGANVTFQDYNKEVLESVTVPNVRLNNEELQERENATSKCKFFSGDWESFDNLLEPSKDFDYILTSETIYNLENYKKIVNILKKRLKDKGIGFVAAKTHYFGVGGGTRQFETELTNSGLKCEVCWKSSGGIQREILKVTKFYFCF